MAPNVPPPEVPFAVDEKMAELSLILPQSDAINLVSAANEQGVTVAQFLRRLIGRALAEARTPEPSIN